MDTLFVGNPIREWIIAVVIAVGALVVARVLYKLFGGIGKRLASKSKSRLDDILIDMLEEPVCFAIFIGGILYATTRLHFGENIDFWIDKGIWTLIAVDITWLVVRLYDSMIEHYLIPLTEKTESHLDDQLLPILRSGGNAIIWIIGIIMSINNLGLDVGGLIAGVGIGGLAFAMAAKDTVANVFGGLTIFTDKPFKLGDRIVIGGYDGFIEEIGIRSTRLRTLEKRLVTIPNSKFADSMVENISEEPARKVKIPIGLTYDMTTEDIGRGIEILKEITESHDAVEPEPFVMFSDFGDFSLGILLIYYIKKDADIFGTMSEINFTILKRFNEEKLEFAFPTQTIYTKADA